MSHPEPSEAIKQLIHKIVADPEAYERERQIEDRKWAEAGWSTHRTSFVDTKTEHRIANNLDPTNRPVT